MKTISKRLFAAFLAVIYISMFVMIAFSGLTEPRTDDSEPPESASEEMGSHGNLRLLFLKTKPTHRQLALGGRQGEVWILRTKRRARAGQSGCPDSSWAGTR